MFSLQPCSQLSSDCIGSYPQRLRLAQLQEVFEGLRSPTRISASTTNTAGSWQGSTTHEQERGMSPTSWLDSVTRRFRSTHVIVFTEPKRPCPPEANAYQASPRDLTSACSPSALKSWLTKSYSSQDADGVNAGESPADPAASISCTLGGG